MIRKLMIALVAGGLLAACNPPAPAPAEQKPAVETPAPAEESPQVESAAPEASGPEPMGAVFEVLREQPYPADLGEGALDEERIYLAFKEGLGPAVGRLNRHWTELAQSEQENFKPPTLPLQPLLDRFAAAMTVHGRPPTWKWWVRFKVELTNWMTIHEDSIKLKDLDGLPEALYVSFALDEEKYPLNKELMRRDTGRFAAGALRMLGVERIDALPPEQRARLAVDGLIYLRRGPSENDPSPLTEAEWRAMLLDQDYAALDENARCYAAMALFDARRIFGPDAEAEAKLQQALPVPGAGSSLKARAVAAYVRRQTALLGGAAAAAEAQRPELEAVLREAAADVVAEGEAFAAAFCGWCDPILVYCADPSALTGEELGALSWLIEMRMLVLADTTLKPGEFRVEVQGKSATAASPRDLKVALLKLQHEADPLLTENRAANIEAWRRIEEQERMMAERDGRD